MSINKVVNIEVNGDEAIKELEKLNKRIEVLEGSVEDLNNELENTGDVAKKDLNEVKKGADAGEKSVKKLGVSFKQLGTIIKAAGIGALLAVFGAFSKIAGESQDAIDGMATSMTFLQLIFTDMMNGFERFQASDSIGDYFKELSKSAKELTELTNLAALAQAVLGRTVAEGERDAERLRITRDDITKSYYDRIEASKDLKEVIDTQLEASTELAEKEVKLALAMYEANPTVAHAIALTEARTKVIEEENRALTQSAEYQASHNALLKEELDFRQQYGSGNVVDVYEGIGSGEFSREGEIQRDLDYNNTLIQSARNRIDEINKIEGISDEEKVRRSAEYYDNINGAAAENAGLEKDLADVKTKYALDAAGALFAGLSAMAEEGSKEQKAFAIMGVIIDTAQAIIATWAGYSSMGPWGVAGAIAQTAFIAATSLKSIQTIASAKPGGGAQSSDAGTPPAPSFNVVGASQTSSLEQQLATEGIRVSSDTPLKSYVVASDVTTAQALDRQIEANAGF